MELLSCVEGILRFWAAFSSDLLGISLTTPTRGPLVSEERAPCSLLDGVMMGAKNIDELQQQKKGVTAKLQ
jgi:hypothetical protein